MNRNNSSVQTRGGHLGSGPLMNSPDMLSGPIPATYHRHVSNWYHDLNRDRTTHATRFGAYLPHQIRFEQMKVTMRWERSFLDLDLDLSTAQASDSFLSDSNVHGVYTFFRSDRLPLPRADRRLLQNPKKRRYSS